MTSASAETLRDSRGLRLGTASRAAADRADEALWQMMTFADTPRLALQAAREADPGWALPLLLDAGFRLGLNQPDDRAAARDLLASAAALASRASARERGHLEALTKLQEGRVPRRCACGTTCCWSIRATRSRCTGRTSGITRAATRPACACVRRARCPNGTTPIRCFPACSVCTRSAWPSATSWRWPRTWAGARSRWRRSSGPEAPPRVPWAVHAVTHAMEMQGRFDDGATWLRQQQAGWTDGTRFASHLWWHLALFRLEALDVAGALRLIDTHLSGAALTHGLQCLDAAALYWRLRVMDVEVDALFKDLLQRWAPEPEQAGVHAFTDWHVVLAMLGAGERAQAEGWVARCAERVMRADEAGRSNHAVARDLGLPLMRALLASERGEHEAAVRGLYLVHESVERLGGSHLRRDLVAQTLMHCAAASQLPHVGRALLNERCLAKPVTPLTRHWAGKLGVAIA